MARRTAQQSMGRVSSATAAAAPKPSVFRRVKIREWLSVSLFGIAVYLWVIHSHKAPLAQAAIVVALVGLIIDPHPLRLPPFLLWFGGWLLWGLLSMTWSQYPEVVLDKWQDYGKIWLIVFAATNAIRTRAQLLGFAVLWLGIYAAYPVRGTLFNIVFGISTMGRFAWNFSFSNFNDLAAYTLLLLGLTVGMFWVAPRKWVRQAALIGIFILPLIIFATQSRGGILGITIFGLLTLAGDKSKIRLLVTGIGIAGVLAVAAPESVWDRILNMKNMRSTETLNQMDSSAEQRYLIWQVAARVISAQPVQGAGLGAYPRAHAAAAARESRFAGASGTRDSHSLYLNVIGETGFIGLIFWIGMIGTLVITFLRLESSMRRRPEFSQMVRVSVALRAGLLGFLVCAIFGSLHKEPYIYLYLMVMAHFAMFAREMVEGSGGPRRNLNPLRLRSAHSD